jgi:hypothetical protein
MNYSLKDIHCVVFAKTESGEQRKVLQDFKDKIPKEVSLSIYEQGRNPVPEVDCRIVDKSGEPFNFNKFCNDGFRETNKEWVFFCNSDLVVSDRSFLHHLLKAANSGYYVLSAFDPRASKQKNLNRYNVHYLSGYECGKHFSGWCFMVHRSVWAKIGGFDEDFPFWCCDNAFLEQIKKIKIESVLVLRSVVYHLGSQTLKTLSDELQNEMTKTQVKKFNRKYNQNLFNLGV